MNYAPGSAPYICLYFKLQTRKRCDTPLETLTPYTEVLAGCHEYKEGKRLKNGFACLQQNINKNQSTKQKAHEAKTTSVNANDRNNNNPQTKAISQTPTKAQSRSHKHIDTPSFRKTAFIYVRTGKKENT